MGVRQNTAEEFVLRSLPTRPPGRLNNVSELDELMNRIESRYDVETVPFKIDDKVLNLLQLKDFGAYIEKLVEAEDLGALDLPYWAKVWDACYLLAYFLGRQPVRPEQRMLEIGAGLGVVGIYAILCGHRVTITDVNEDALLFARANALLNGIGDADIRRLDWNASVLPSQYEVIFGSEVVYDRQSYPLLVGFFKRALAPDGIIFLAKNAELHAPAFFAELGKDFEFKHTTQTVRTEGEPRRIELYAIRRKSGNAASA